MLEQIAILYFCRCDLFKYRTAENFRFFSKFPAVKEILRADGIISPRFDDSYVTIFKNVFAGKMSLDAMILAINAGLLGLQFFHNSNNDFPDKLQLLAEYPSNGNWEVWHKEKNAILEQIDIWDKEFPVSDKHPSLLTLYSRNPSELYDTNTFSHSVLERCKSEHIEKFKKYLKNLLYSRHNLFFSISYSPMLCQETYAIEFSKVL